MKLIATKLEKSYNRRLIFKNLNFELAAGETLVITGPNGSGKSTLIKLICGLLSPTKGSIEFFEDDRKVSRELIYHHMGLVSPYLQFYFDLTAWENLSFFARARSGEVDRQRILEVMEMVGLRGREHDTLKTYSSGMLQRVKYAAALYHDPYILLIDEPSSNLDEQGTRIVYRMIEEQRTHKILVVATNEPRETRFATKRIDLAP